MDRDSLFIEPTVITGVTADDATMNDEVVQDWLIDWDFSENLFIIMKSVVIRNSWYRIYGVL